MSLNIDRELRRKYRESSAAARAAGIEPRATGRRPRFSPEQARALVEERNAGRSIADLAREHRTSESVIARYVREGFRPARWRA